MTERIHIPLGQLARRLKRDADKLEDRIYRAVEKTAFRAVKPIRKRVPKAFGELYDSIQGYSEGKHGGPVTSADAPHAGAVEIGSAPHTPDFRRLVEWVKLRGAQGLTSSGRIRKRYPRSSGPTTPRQARLVAQEFKRLVIRGRSTPSRPYRPGSLGKFGTPARAGRQIHGRFTPIDAPEMIAQRISKAIQVNGTKPHWYVRESLPDIKNILDYEMKKNIFVADRRAHARARRKP
jgi:hypothetical protein